MKSAIVRLGVFIKKSLLELVSNRAILVYRKGYFELCSPDQCMDGPIMLQNGTPF